MKIILKYYNLAGKLRIAKTKEQKKKGYRFIILKNKKHWPCCDFKRKCINKAYVEVYPKLMGTKKSGWSYLCKKHYYQEQKRLKQKLPACFHIKD